MKYLILLFSILLIGCSRPIECENNTIIINNTINKTITINNTVEIIKYVDKIIEKEKPCPNEKYINGLRIEAKRCERNLTFNNLSECNDNLNITEIELKDCKKELCNEWNNSWC